MRENWRNSIFREEEVRVNQGEERDREGGEVWYLCMRGDVGIKVHNT